MKTHKLIVAVVALSALITNAHAESRLFPTDILKQGEIDTSADVRHQTYSYNFSGNRPGIHSTESTSESLQARYGLGANWHIGAALNYASQAVARSDYSSAHYVSNTEGARNPTFWATYGIINAPNTAFSLNAELLVTPKTTNYSSSYATRIIAGWKSSETLKLYGSYEIREQKNAMGHDSNGIGVGAYQEIANGITLIPFAGYARYNASNTYSSYTQFQLGLSANIELARNTYITPSISNFGQSAINSNDGLIHQDSTANGLNLKLGLYHLF